MNDFRISYGTVVDTLARHLRLGREADARSREPDLSEGMRELNREDSLKAFSTYHSLMALFGNDLNPWDWENLKNAADARARGVHTVKLSVEVPISYEGDRGKLVAALIGRRLVWMAHDDDEPFLYDASAVEVQINEVN